MVDDQFSWAVAGVPAWLQVSVSPDSDSWLSSKAGAVPLQELVVVMLSRMCVPVVSLATICSTDVHVGYAAGSLRTNVRAAVTPSVPTASWSMPLEQPSLNSGQSADSPPR